MVTMARSSMPGWPEKFAVRAATGPPRRTEAQDVDVVDGVLDQAASAGLLHVGPPLRAVGALNGKYWSSRKTTAMGRPSGPTATRSRSSRNTGAERSTRPTGPVPAARRPPQPGVGTGPGRWPAVSRRRWPGRPPGPRSTAVRCAAVGVQIQTASQRSTSSCQIADDLGPMAEANPAPAFSPRVVDDVMSASMWPATIMACRLSPWAQAISPVPANPIRSITGTLRDPGPRPLRPGVGFQFSAPARASPMHRQSGTSPPPAWQSRRAPPADRRRAVRRRPEIGLGRPIRRRRRIEWCRWPDRPRSGALGEGRTQFTDGASPCTSTKRSSADRPAPPRPARRDSTTARRASSVLPSWSRPGMAAAAPSTVSSRPGPGSAARAPPPPPLPDISDSLAHGVDRTRLVGELDHQLVDGHAGLALEHLEPDDVALDGADLAATAPSTPGRRAARCRMRVSTVYGSS